MSHWCLAPLGNLEDTLLRMKLYGGAEIRSFVLGILNLCELGMQKYQYG
jgi:hypothetical protein